MFSLVITVALLGAATSSEPAPTPPQQLLLVTTADWDATAGSAWLFEDGKRVMGPLPIHVGKAGMGWGVGVHTERPIAGPVKQEGDRKAPAGIFQLTGAWTRQDAARSGAHCVDDVRAPEYNRIVSLPQGEATRWRSAERMSDYRLALVVDHNPDAVPGAGSCIFLHEGQRPTLGCTAFERQTLDRLAARLRYPARFVQLPVAAYHVVKDAWRLPQLAARGE